MERKRSWKVRLVFRQSKTLKICANHQVLPTISIQDHAGNEKSCVWHATDFSDEELKEELFCIRFASTEIEIWEMIRMIATARIVMPKAMVGLLAGHVRFSMSEQELCFLAGANSIFTGEKLLTTPNNVFDADKMMFKVLGQTPKAPDFNQKATSFEAETEKCEQEATAS